MKYEWVHECSLEWMQARKQYLTASDVRKLWPKTKTGRDRKVTDLDYLQVYLEKNQETTKKDCFSYDWAARGHILEPYAIQQFNTHYTGLTLNHWDDCLIYDSEKKIAYSPDALDIPQRMFESTVELPFYRVGAQCLGEVKSYNPAKHIETVFTPKDQVEERIQIAVAMYISPDIKTGYLILFNPEISEAQLAVKEYSRDNLAEEIKIVDSIVEKWNNLDPRIAVQDQLILIGDDTYYESTVSIERIYEDYCVKNGSVEWRRMNTI